MDLTISLHSYAQINLSGEPLHLHMWLGSRQCCMLFAQQFSHFCWLARNSYLSLCGFSIYFVAHRPHIQTQTLFASISMVFFSSTIVAGFVINVVIVVHLLFVKFCEGKNEVCWWNVSCVRTILHISVHSLLRNIFRMSEKGRHTHREKEN